VISHQDDEVVNSKMRIWFAFESHGIDWDLVTLHVEVRQ
jgi:hypothetical protein